MIFNNYFLRLPIVDFINGICAHPGVNCNDLFTALTGLKIIIDTFSHK